VVFGLVVLTLLGEWPLLHGRVVAGLDGLTQFYPWYELVGATLREGRLPGWNPHAFAGAPLAANPLSGWTYLPAMLAFTLLPLTPAIVAYQLTHVLLATLGAYGLGRALGLDMAGAALAAVAYGQGGLITAEAACCFAFASVGAWLPVLLLGSALAIRAGGWRGRVRGWSLAALALSQIFASWPGQGSYYALLVFGSFVAYHTFRFSPRTVAHAVMQASVPVLLGAGLAAAGLLPRAELQALSSLAIGYAAEDLHVGGWTPQEWVQLAEPGYWYAGLLVVGLATLAPVLARRWPPTWYLLGLGTILLALALPGPNPAHDLFGLLPGFSRLHPHLPDRIMTVFMLVPALLAGATLDTLARRRPIGLVVATLLVLVAFADLRVAREKTFAGYAGAEGVHRLFTVDPDAYYAPTPAARFLQERFSADGPFRYLGYGPDPGGLAYTQRFANPGTVRLGVNNRAVSDRLLDMQGYDAIHLARFDDFLKQANGEPQNYHNADVFARGLGSPLLDLLAARYVVTPSALAGSANDPVVMNPGLWAVFDDGETRVLENGEALPWAWIVHDSRAATAAEARALLDGGQVDPRRTALLEPPTESPLFASMTPGDAPHPGPLPEGEGLVLPLSIAMGRGPGGGGEDTVELLMFEADRLVVRASSDEDGFLVVSEVAYPGWQATIDGEPVPVFVANGLLRAVALPAGEHVVELRFESPTLLVGMLISLASLAMVVPACAATLASPSTFRWPPRSPGATRSSR